MDHATTTWVGLDAHKKFIHVAMRRPSGELEEWRVPYTVKDVQKLAGKLTRKAPGPCAAATKLAPSASRYSAGSKTPKQRRACPAP